MLRAANQVILTILARRQESLFLPYRRPAEL